MRELLRERDQQMLARDFPDFVPPVLRQPAMRLGFAQPLRGAVQAGECLSACEVVDFHRSFAQFPSLIAETDEKLTPTFDARVRGSGRRAQGVQNSPSVEQMPESIGWRHRAK